MATEPRLDESMNLILQRAWSEGDIVIVATIGDGPHAGLGALCVSNRAVIKDATKDVRRMGDDLDLTSLAGSIRNNVARPLSPQENQNLMDDLTILMVLATMGRCNDAVLKACGLFSIHLAVNPDTSQPWNKRGFLTASDARTEDPTKIYWGKKQ